MNSKSCKTSDPHRLLLNLKDEIKLINMLFYQIFKKIKRKKIRAINLRTMNLKYQLQHGMKNLNYLMDHILDEIFKIIC